MTKCCINCQSNSINSSRPSVGQSNWPSRLITNNHGLIELIVCQPGVNKSFSRQCRRHLLVPHPSYHRSSVSGTACVLSISISQAREVPAAPIQLKTLGALSDYLRFLSEEVDWILSKGRTDLCTSEQVGNIRSMVKRHLLRHPILPKVVYDNTIAPQALW
ncbi:hypothetical protein V1525DRAFT_414566 [Lipomyces kononenkoae]|uniref:Uncharacterized protein n=1 Tax=Lipomyces kononenkoae TaxID=34357 RepID=A0ACC3SQV9_LIPKO